MADWLWMFDKNIIGEGNRYRKSTRNCSETPDRTFAKLKSGRRQALMDNFLGRLYKKASYTVFTAHKHFDKQIPPLMTSNWQFKSWRSWYWTRPVHLQIVESAVPFRKHYGKPASFIEQEEDIEVISRLLYNSNDDDERHPRRKDGSTPMETAKRWESLHGVRKYIEQF